MGRVDRDGSLADVAHGQVKTRARQLGVPFTGTPEPLNAITDVSGVEVGHMRLISGSASVAAGASASNAVRTGVTAILPKGKKWESGFARWFAGNGFGEMTGVPWVVEGGLEAISQILGGSWPAQGAGAQVDTVAEGNVGGGTGMVAHGFKGGIGTASRLVGAYTLGVLVQANYGTREGLTIAGVPMGREILGEERSRGTDAPGDRDGSIIVVVATDAPLLPHQLERLARRVPMGIARLGGTASNGSGDIFLAFSTANPGAAAPTGATTLQWLPNGDLSPFFTATVEATEEAIVNALVAAETMTGVNGHTVYALPHDQLRTILRKYNRLAALPG